MTMTDRPGKVFVTTFGCQMNEYDTQIALRLLTQHNFVQVDDPQKADFIFVNTCAIREKAEQKLFSYLGRLRGLKEENPNLIISVGGCVAQHQGKKIFKAAPFVDLVLGTHAVNLLPEMLEKVHRESKRIVNIDFNGAVHPSPPPASEASDISAFLTIMRGCDNYCAYCVVPFVRGREISRPPADILEEARSLLEHGVKEITLLGQNVNSYGHSLNPSLTFTDLIKEVAKLDGLLRLRFTTSHPKDLSPELIEALAEVDVLCEHLHLPVQSGSNRILEAMGRKYTREHYLGLVEDLRRACPGIALTTDIIVGFPGETEQDFRETMSLIEEVRFDGMYSFKYSDRPLTRASKMAEKIEDKEKKYRLAELQDTQKEITIEQNRKLMGRQVEVLVEGRSGRHDGQYFGRTRTHRIVNFACKEMQAGRIVYPIIEKAWANSLLGRLPGDDNSDKKK